MKFSACDLVLWCEIYGYVYGVGVRFYIQDLEKKVEVQEDVVEYSFKVGSLYNCIVEYCGSFGCFFLVTFSVLEISYYFDFLYYWLVLFILNFKQRYIVKVFGLCMLIEYRFIYFYCYKNFIIYLFIVEVD